MASYLSYFSSIVRTAAEAIEAYITGENVQNEEENSAEPSEWIKIDNYRGILVETEEKEAKIEKKVPEKIEEVDENSENYVCPSVDYDFLLDSNCFVVVFEHAHGLVTQEMLYVHLDDD
ncbi:unnamed protein product [Caenorhabditis sp. 36 PRJEB53466]|nr:unnamed protein product [Caenorhabditis sp. 36 PRJEB53466]